MKTIHKLMLLVCALALVLAVGCSSGEQQNETTSPTPSGSVSGDNDQDNQTPDDQDNETPDEQDNDKSDYPVMEPIDTTGMTLETTENGDFRVAYPSDTWIAFPEISPLTLLYVETADTESAVNVNIQASQPYRGKLDEAIMNSLLEEFKMFEGYMTIDVSELRLLNDEVIIYSEMTSQYTDEYIDLMIDMGAITEEDLDMYGGREILLDQPPTQQLSVYAVVDDYLFIYIGTYYEEAQKDEVIDLITLLIENTEKL